MNLEKHQRTAVADSVPYMEEFSSISYILIWAILLVFTGVTIAVAGMDLGVFGVPVALTIASIKAMLVFWFFMHLKFESRTFKIMFALALLIVALMILLTFMDVWYR